MIRFSCCCEGQLFELYLSTLVPSCNSALDQYPQRENRETHYRCSSRSDYAMLTICRNALRAMTSKVLEHLSTRSNELIIFGILGQCIGIVDDCTSDRNSFLVDKQRAGFSGLHARKLPHLVFISTILITLLLLTGTACAHAQMSVVQQTNCAFAGGGAGPNYTCSFSSTPAGATILASCLTSAPIVSFSPSPTPALTAGTQKIKNDGLWIFSGLPLERNPSL